MKNLEINQSNINAELNFLGKPLLIFVLVFVSAIILAIVSLNKINEIRGQISELTNTRDILTKKVSVLQKVTEVLPGDITFVDVALPNKGAVLYGLGQVRYTAFANNIALSNIKTGSSVPDGDLIRNSISFDAEGNEVDLYNFLDSFSKSLPLMNIDKLSMSKNSDFVLASVSLNIYSAELPKQLPSLKAVTPDFTEEEIKLLSELVTFTMPTFVEPTSTISNINDRVDPFNLSPIDTNTINLEGSQEE